MNNILKRFQYKCLWLKSNSSYKFENAFINRSLKTHFYDFGFITSEQIFYFWKFPPLTHSLTHPLTHTLLIKNVLTHAQTVQFPNYKQLFVGSTPHARVVIGTT